MDNTEALVEEQEEKIDVTKELSLLAQAIETIEANKKTHLLLEQSLDKVRLAVNSPNGYCG